MDAKEITITLLLLVAGIAVGIWARGGSDGRAWTNPVPA
jgi:hypothetical protein